MVLNFRRGGGRWLAVAAISLSGCGETVFSDKPDLEEMRQIEAVVMKPVLPPLRETSLVLPGDTLEDTVADALSRMGTAAVPGLVEALRSNNPEVRAGAARALAMMGPPAADAIPALISALNDPNEVVRRYAIRALGRLGERAKEATPVLLEMLKTPRHDGVDSPNPPQ